MINFLRIKIRDFLRKNTVVEITKTLVTQEPVISIWVFGYLAMRKRFSFVVQEWIDTQKDETFEI